MKISRMIRASWRSCLAATVAILLCFTLGACGEEQPTITYEPKSDKSSFITNEPFGSVVTYEPVEGLIDPESSEPSDG